MKRFWTGIASSLLLAGVAALPASARAADDAAANAASKKDVEKSSESVSESPRSESPRASQRVLPLRAGDRRGGAPVWIGAMCIPADATLRAQLSLPDDVGLVVARVMPGSPADRAGFKMHDVVVAIDENPTGDVPSLSAAVEKTAVDDADPPGLKFTIIRAGKKQSLTVLPEKRPEVDVGQRAGAAQGQAGATPAPGAVEFDAKQREEHVRRLQDQLDKLSGRLPEPDAKRLQEWLDQMRRGENQPFRLQLFGPGLVVQGNGQGPAVQLPIGVNIVIVRNAGEPTRIMVTRGTERWDLTEKELDKLPDDLRDTVRAMVIPK